MLVARTLPHPKQELRRDPRRHLITTIQFYKPSGHTFLIRRLQWSQHPLLLRALPISPPRFCFTTTSEWCTYAAPRTSKHCLHNMVQLDNPRHVGFSVVPYSCNSGSSCSAMVAVLSGQGDGLNECVQLFHCSYLFNNETSFCSKRYSRVSQLPTAAHVVKSLAGPGYAHVLLTTFLRIIVAP